MEEMNGWGECKRDLYHRLQVADKNIETLNIKVELLLTKIVALETRSGLMGLIAGSVPAAIAIILYFILK